MHRIEVALVIFAAVFVTASAVPLNGTSYSKVAKWGAANVPNEGRSSGQSLYTQRSDVRISSGQRASPVYYGSTSRVGTDKTGSKLPGKGEVIIQDRFNPPPYFQFEKDGEDPKTVVYASRPKTDSYDSQVTSYNPMPSGIPVNAKPALPGPVYPPNVGSYAPPMDKKPNGYIYDAPKAPKMPAISYPGPYAPLFEGDASIDAPPSDDASPSDDAPNDDDDQRHKTPDDADFDDYAPTNEGDASPPQDSKPPEYSYPDFHHHHAPKLPIDHPNLNFKSPAQNEPALAPPPTGPSHDFSKHIPEYLDQDPTGQFPYDIPFDHHHHVYKEVVHTTTTEAPNNMRVNNGHYSYYYLGRKLWYIPLYFSVYFIIYITVLILKSIARHKVNFVHDLDKVNSRADDGGYERAAQVQESIDSFKRRFIAM